MVVEHVGVHGPPDTGLDLTQVWGYEVLASEATSFLLADVRPLGVIDDPTDPPDDPPGSPGDLTEPPDDPPAPPDDPPDAPDDPPHDLPGQPSDPPGQPADPPSPVCDGPVGSRFPDAEGSGHGRTIECLAGLGVGEGLADGRFRPTEGAGG